jgi:uncharacterized damage-inducible protein DinB
MVSYPTWEDCMTRFLFVMALAAGGAAMIFGADAPQASMGKVLDDQIRSAEREIVGLAEAMPADKYGFRPTAGEFKNVRTFSQQMTHIASILYGISAAALGEKDPSEIGQEENGPSSIADKAAAVKYLKDAFAYAHKAASAVTTANAMDMMQSPFGSRKTPRIDLVTTLMFHSFDHYGQAVVYARMNGVVPPASRGQ